VAVGVELATIISSTYIKINIVTPPLLNKNKDVFAFDG
jgi:hypothetical protein